jgi:tetratricopeptide (TPR) repeat protein
MKTRAAFRKILFTSVIAACFAAAAPASAQLSPDWQACSGQDGSADDNIAACTRLIRSGSETGNNLSIAYSNRGHNYLRKRDVESAIQDFDEAIRFNAGNAQAWTNRGEAYQRKKDYRKAISDHTEAIRLDPNHQDAWFNRGIAHHNSGDTQRAISDYRQALRVNPNDSDARRELKSLGVNEWSAAPQPIPDPLHGFMHLLRGAGITEAQVMAPA